MSLSIPSRWLARETYHGCARSTGGSAEEKESEAVMRYEMRVRHVQVKHEALYDLYEDMK